MKIIKKIFDLNKKIKNFKSFGFVPTMGGIHKGHISLIKNSQNKCKKTIVTIFINPTQFNDINDFKKYPKNFKKDIKILKKLNIDYLFLPIKNEIYHEKIKNFKLKKADKILCAKHRIGHFEGVLNIMNRLLKIIKAKHVFMGEKDFQQLFLVKKFLGKKYQNKIYSCKTVRDKNFLALSSRNFLLSKNQIKKAGQISKSLLFFKSRLKKNNKLHKNVLFKKKELKKKFNIKIDYLEIRNEKNLGCLIKKKNRLFVAYHIGKVRLIDNF